jgi:hypothetical protein
MTCDSTSDGATAVPIRPTASEPKSQLRIPGPSARPSGSYWRTIEAEAADLAARSVLVDEPALAAAPSEDDAAALREAFARLRSRLPNTRLILTAAPGVFARDAMPLAVRLPVDALYLDTLARPRLLVEALALLPPGLELLTPETVEEAR